ncbi:transglutaminase [Bacillus sp. 7586-K]|uniref:Transglutaminase-like putative cysteine protease n=1 Tax=Metabacillus niabensis TaxID=324854 RepID=A0ABT9Z081_9BACI|nr:transglutaminase-like domain-containing protein [Metabacillus niabensis]MDQ0225602.1 transglutaminase-like putative cysteine protease [Metabacillus niabensis]PAD69702.1 transglutaminase [Bacillus sp. 7586-K]
MKLTPESNKLADYLEELNVVDYSHPMIQKKVAELFKLELSEIEKIKIAYEFVRDQISHSWDIQSDRVTCKASDVLFYQEGICYAKANLLAAILRSVGIPTGFCYQRLMIFDTPEDGYSLHALNGVFLTSLNRWIRLDARGNKPGVNAQFSINEEYLAFPIREEFAEKDYPTIFDKPNPKTIKTLENHRHALDMYKYYLPEVL